MSAALVLQRHVPRPRPAAHAVPGALRAADLRRASSPGASCSSGTTAWSTTCWSTTCTSLDQPSFWLIGNNASSRWSIVAIWRSWPFAFLMLTAGLQNIPTELYEAAAVDGAGVWRQARPSRCRRCGPVNLVLRPDAVPVDVQRLQHAVRAVRADGARRRRTSSRSTSTTNSFVTWNFGLGLGDVRAAAAVPARWSPAVCLLHRPDRRSRHALSAELVPRLPLGRASTVLDGVHRWCRST